MCPANEMLRNLEMKNEKYTVVMVFAIKFMSYQIYIYLSIYEFIRAVMLSNVFRNALAQALAR